MAKKQLDPAISEVLKAYGFGHDAAWDCHGTWVVYHRVLEQIAAKAGIKFEPPQVLEANGPAKSVALCVTGRLYKVVDGGLGEKFHNQQTAEEWSIGEAAPGNNKNAYPYAMAEKRAKDRVILKLIGLHGLAYSEDEADDFKASAPVAETPKRVSAVPTPTPSPAGTDTARDTEITAYLAIAQTAMANCDHLSAVKGWWEQEESNRKKLGLIEGSPRYKELVAHVDGRQKHLKAQRILADAEAAE